MDGQYSEEQKTVTKWRVKMEIKTLAIIILSVLLIGTAIYIGVGEYKSHENTLYMNGYNEGFKTGYSYGINDTIAYIQSQMGG